MKLIKPNSIDLEVERLVSVLNSLQPGTKEYYSVSENLKSLCEARSKKKVGFIETTTIIMITADILELLLVLNFERYGVLTSRAMGRLGKLIWK